MTLTLTASLIGLALVFTVVHIIAPRVPLWIPVLLLCVALFTK